MMVARFAGKLGPGLCHGSSQRDDAALRSCKLAALLRLAVYIPDQSMTRATPLRELSGLHLKMWPFK